MNDSPSNWTKELSIRTNELFFQAMSQRCISIVAINVLSYNTVILSSKYDPQSAGRIIKWCERLEYFVANYVHAIDRERVLSALSIDNLLLFYNSKLKEKSIEIRCKVGKTEDYEWVEMVVTPLSSQENALFVTTKSISDVKLHKHVLDIFLFHQNCDFFILVDLKENNYRAFDVSAGLLPAPEMNFTDYIEDMVKFNKKYITPNEVEKVINIMMPETLKEIIDQQEQYSFTCGIYTDNGEYRRAKMQIISFDRIKQQVIITRSDITDMYLDEKFSNEQMFKALHAAQRDLLTGLYNQTTTADIVSQILDNYQGEMAAVMFIDIDNFKMVNDTLGHLKGNEVLKNLSEYLKKLLKDESVLGRVGGDEFLLLMPNISSVQEVYDTGKLICKSFENLRDIVGDLPISCSVGISLYPQDGLEYELLVQKADQALYCSKRYGKSRFSLYSQEMEQYKHVSSFSKIQ